MTDARGKSMPRYHDLLDDTRLPGRWQLGSPLDEQGNEIDPWQFKKGQVLELGCVPRFPLDISGNPLDFSWAAFSIPVVHVRFVELFERVRIDGVQFIPAEVEGRPEPWYILNALQIIRCIDDVRSEAVQYWKPEDNRPDKLGQYRAVSRRISWWPWRQRVSPERGSWRADPHDVLAGASLLAQRAEPQRQPGPHLLCASSSVSSPP
jgi:hypothetical protein